MHVRMPSELCTCPDPPVFTPNTVRPRQTEPRRSWTSRKTEDFLYTVHVLATITKNCPELLLHITFADGVGGLPVWRRVDTISCGPVYGIA